MIKPAACRSNDHPAVVGYRRQLKTAAAAVTAATNLLDQQIRQALRSLQEEDDEEESGEVSEEPRSLEAFSSSASISVKSH